MTSLLCYSRQAPTLTLDRDRSGGSESGGGGGYARRSSGSDPGAISRRGSGHADAAHYAALEEKVTHAKPCCFLSLQSAWAPRCGWVHRV